MRQEKNLNISFQLSFGIKQISSLIVKKKMQNLIMICALKTLTIFNFPSLLKLFCDAAAEKNEK